MPPSAEFWFDLVVIVGIKDICFPSISSEGMPLFYQKFAGGYIIVKYRSSLIFVTIDKILAELWSFFDLVFSSPERKYHW